MTILILLVALILLLVFLFNISHKISDYKRDLEEIKRQLSDISRTLRNREDSVKDITPPIHEKTTRPAAPLPIEPAPIPTPVPLPVTPPADENKEPESIAAFTAPEPVSMQDEWDNLKNVAERKTENEPSWWSNRENMEEFIGGNLANKIGIGVLVLGIAFFVRYAIDKDWINELGRVSIGLFCGALLIGIAYRIRNRYRAFSSVLVGGGLAILYFSIAFAFHEYHLISQQAAFIIMLLTTAFAVILALYYSRQEIAVLAILGGFATPFLASTGNDNYVALFTYLAILCGGMTVLSWFKKWPAINIIAMIGTTLIYGGWLVLESFAANNDDFPFRDGLLFATVFFLLFMSMHILNNLRLRRTFGGMDYTLVLATQFLYYGAGRACVSFWDNDYGAGIFTAGLGLFNLGLTAFFHRKNIVDKNFVWLLTGLSISFISLFAFVQLEGNEMTLFWAAESLLLLGLFIRTRIPMLFRASFLLQALAIISLLFTWVLSYLYNSSELPIIANKAFITGLGVSLGLYLRSVIVSKKQLNEPFLTNYLGVSWKAFYRGFGFVLLVFVGLWEIIYQFNRAIPEAPVYLLYMHLYIMLVATIALIIFRRSSGYPMLLIWMCIASVVIYLFYTSSSIQLQEYLALEDMAIHFLPHWLTAVLLLLLLYRAIQYFRKQLIPEWKPYMRLCTWVVALSLIFVLSVELYHVNLSLNLSDPVNRFQWENLYYKAQLSILWGLSAFAMIWLGLRYKYQPLRIISLSLFCVTLLKLFLYDIRNIPPGGKIASFILLGVLLLTISFMYQRIKAILIDEKEREA